MHLLEEYARLAAEWRAQAAKAKLPDHRDSMLAIGEAWQKMAEERRVHLQRIAKHEAEMARLEALLKGLPN
jgi:hypothetical protein